jgi:allantoicase
MRDASRPAEFAGLVNLADERLGARAVATNDEFFAPKENLLRPHPATFDPDRYTERGKWMDGWESRRRREPGHDWCVVRLGVPGLIRGVDIDTSFFLGNHPPHASLEGANLDSDGDAALALVSWTEILARVPLAPGAHNPYSVASNGRWSHVRLNIYPDGGVARLKIYGVSVPDWASLGGSGTIDLASVVQGGGIVTANDMFFGAPENMLMPWVAESMGDGWETRRKRGPGHDWSIVRLGRSGRIQRIEVDTMHFKGNYPDRCSLDGCLAPEARDAELTSEAMVWKAMLPPTKLQAHTNHVFEKELAEVGPVSHVRINIFPDGGISRLRVLGTAT